MEINRKLQRETANKVGVSYEEVSDVISFQWKYLSEGMKSSDAIIRAPKLGNFTIRINKVLERREYLENIIKDYQEKLGDPTHNPIRTLQIIDNHEEELEILYKKLFQNSGGIYKLSVPYANKKRGRTEEIKPVPPEYLRLLGS